MTRQQVAPPRDWCLRPSCPACGPFGWRARRRARHYDEKALTRFHAYLATSIRNERAATWQEFLRDVPPWQRDIMRHHIERRFG